jgi:hypothetical protein
MTLRDLVVIGGAVFAEPSSLAAFWHMARCLPRALRARREIMRRRRIDDAALACWFSFEPASVPAGSGAEISPVEKHFAQSGQGAKTKALQAVP